MLPTVIPLFSQLAKEESRSDATKQHFERVHLAWPRLTVFRVKEKQEIIVAESYIFICNVSLGQSRSSSSQKSMKK